MTFTEWCNSKGIKDNWRDALFHHMQATRSGSALDSEVEWEVAWSELLTQALADLNLQDGKPKLTGTKFGS